MSDLSILLGDKREALAHELAGLAENAVESSSGISGMAVKGLLAAAKKVNSDIVSKAANRLLPEILETLQPRWSEYNAQGTGDFGTFLNANSDAVVDDILEVLDRNAQKVDFPAVQKGYNSIRSKASGLIKPHLPMLGDVIERHMKAA
ncbi:hypothetical protein P4N68_00605 [Corynebacterium felinum]|uniref:Uncharacterized UPF0160 family protein n=1 Tax=Corynebacterium felinum TaxID=131318 RepID=A0ABU2B6Q4_9CORY|nr:hypothetical protein [Corynebacterium felinum]MDF5819579.1 hypothetical protein [Corynebacterium felinum]MDR7354293.1 uncharacterized UPF0160 family protein [Corynebacterium felinum]WJY93670.1 hypothetical protein CFELI_00030 [Corynebacterium felinum]